MALKKKIVTFKRTGKGKKSEGQKKAIERLITLLSILDKGRSISSKEVAETLDVAQRTVQRDIKVLKNAGYPIDELENGRHQFVEGFTLRKFSLTEEQASLMSFMFEIASGLGETFEESFKDLFNRLRAKDLQTAYFAKVPAKRTPLPASTDIKYLEAAILDCDRVQISYVSAAKVEKEYCLEPLKIAFFDGFWYLVAIKKGETRIQKYRIDRVKSVTILEEAFIPRVNIDKILNDSVNIWFDEVRGDRVLIRVAPEAVQFFKECQYLPLQKTVEERKDGSIVVETFPAQPDEIRRIIMHWIPCLTVLEPAAFKAEIKTMVEEYIKSC
ncbi:MAG: WYL domain-containing protein [Candidatus Omnitrophica bacterium]|nr:WYL domain-containing protein [Candidatus Omnitrophota bacterium]